jgi:hypothetical protein
LKIKDGKLVVAGQGEHRLALEDEIWEDYELTTKATLSKGQENVAVSDIK